MDLNVQALIIGGGATGTSIARDLAMRGVSVCLLERGDLASGTTGNYHGLLHSGARYVTNDLATAQANAPRRTRSCGGSPRTASRIPAGSS